MMNEAITTFSDIEYKPLRTWNRCVVFFNLKEDSGAAAAERYLRTIPKNEWADMYEMYERVKKEGREKVLKSITFNMPLQEEEEAIVH
jgi:hypothetical protein